MNFLKVLQTEILYGDTEILGFLLLSQGEATVPNGVVMYRSQHAIGEFKVHYINFETNSLAVGGYHTTAIEAWLDFYARVEKNAYYVQHGTPLTGEPQ